jgi:Ca2+-binding RTX toxin-like protein
LFGYSFELQDGDLIITFSYGPPSEGSAIFDHAQHTVTIEDFQDGDFGIHIYDPEIVIAEGAEIYGFDQHLEQIVVVGREPDFAYPVVSDAEALAYINNNGDFLTILAALDPNSTGSIPQTPPSSPPGIDGDEDDNQIDGGAPGELIRSHGGDDTVNANGGDDRVDAGGGNDIVHLGTGADLSITAFPAAKATTRSAAAPARTGCSVMRAMM